MQKTHHRRLHHHAFEFTILFLLLTTGFFAFNYSFGQPAAQFQVGLVTASSYVVWGVFHHTCDGDLNWKIVIEYAGVAFLIVAMLWILLSYIY